MCHLHRQNSSLLIYVHNAPFRYEYIMGCKGIISDRFLFLWYLFRLMYKWTLVWSLLCHLHSQNFCRCRCTILIKPKCTYTSNGIDIKKIKIRRKWYPCNPLCIWFGCCQKWGLGIEADKAQLYLFKGGSCWTNQDSKLLLLFAYYFLKEKTMKQLQHLFNNING